MVYPNTMPRIVSSEHRAGRRCRGVSLLVLSATLLPYMTSCSTRSTPDFWS
jgi:hypothetical protein